MKTPALLALLACSLAAQTARYPSAVATDADLAVVANRLGTRLSFPMGAGDTQMIVASAAGIVANMILTIDPGGERVWVCAVNGTTLTLGKSACPNADGRGFDGTTPASHAIKAAVSNYIGRYEFTQHSQEIQAVESSLGANLANATANAASAVAAAAAAAAGPQLNSANYAFAAQSPGGSLSGNGAVPPSGTNNTVTLTPVPKGVNGADALHYLYVSAGTGTAEACLITGGSAVAGAASGSLIINCQYNHTGAWTIQSATAGMAEAVAALPNGGRVNLPPGTLTVYATTNHGAWHQFVGSGATTTGGKGTFISTAMTAPVFRYTEANNAENVESGILYAEFGISAQNGIQINSTTPGPIQAILRPAFRHIFLGGSYYALGDAQRWTATPPTLVGLTAKGVGISCNACFDAHFSNVYVRNYGIGIYIQGDQNVVGDGSRLALDGVWVWINGATFHANMNKIHDNDLLANYRVGGITAVSAFDTVIQSNYFENGCLSSEFVRSSNSLMLDFSHNHIEDPNNGPQCGQNAGASDYSPSDNTTPLLSLDDLYGDVLAWNSLGQGNGKVPPIEFLHTYWLYLIRTNQYTCDAASNGAYFPCPLGAYNAATGAFYATQPSVLAGAVNPLLFRATNIPGTVLGGASPDTFAHTWKQSSVLKQADNTTGRWVLGTGVDYEPTFPIPNQEYYSYLLNVTGRKIGTGAGVFAIQYTDAAGTVSSFTPQAELTFALTTEVETRSQIVSIPSSAVGPGKFMVALDGSNAEIEQVEFLPLKYANLALGASVASGATVAATSQFFHITGTAEIHTMTPPAGFYSGQVCAIPNEVFTTATGGAAPGFAKASTAIVGQALCWMYHPGENVWYPSY